MASASTSRVVPSGVVPATATVAGRATLPVRSGTLMQPSQATAGTPAATTSGSNSTTSPAQDRALAWPVTSRQNARRPTPIWGAGRPTKRTYARAVSTTFAARPAAAGAAQAQRPQAAPDLGGGQADAVVVGAHGVDQVGGQGGGPGAPAT